MKAQKKVKSKAKKSRLNCLIALRSLVFSLCTVVYFSLLLVGNSLPKVPGLFFLRIACAWLVMGGTIRISEAWLQLLPKKLMKHGIAKAILFFSNHQFHMDAIYCAYFLITGLVISVIGTQDALDAGISIMLCGIALSVIVPVGSVFFSSGRLHAMTNHVMRGHERESSPRPKMGGNHSRFTLDGTPTSSQTDTAQIKVHVESPPPKPISTNLSHDDDLCKSLVLIFCRHSGRRSRSFMRLLFRLRVSLIIVSLCGFGAIIAASLLLVPDLYFRKHPEIFDSSLFVIAAAWHALVLFTFTTTKMPEKRSKSDSSSNSTPWSSERSSSKTPIVPEKSARGE